MQSPEQTDRGEIKVLHVLQRNSGGGIFRMVNDLLCTLLQEDKVAKTQVAFIDDKNFAGECSFDEVSIPHKYIKGNIFIKFFALKKLAQVHDIVHLHGFTPWQALAILVSGRRIVYTNHGLLGAGRRLKWYEYLKRWLMKLFLRYGVDCIVNISQYAKRRMIMEYQVSAEKNTVIYNCTRWDSSLSRFSNNGEIKIGFHGRFASPKRIDRLLAVAAQIANNIPVKVVLVGNGPLKAFLLKKSTELGLAIDIMGYQPDVRPLVESFDIEIFPSDEEYLGLAVLEAIQVGKPVFIFKDAGGPIEIFDSETNWFVCSSEKEMSKKIISLTEPDIQEMVLQNLKKLQQRVNTLFNPVAFATAYERVYFDVYQQ